MGQRRQVHEKLHTATAGGPRVTRRDAIRRFSKNSSDRVWLASFQFSTTEAFILEFGPGYIRFWYNHAQLLDGDNNILEIDTPWGADDLTRNGKFGLSLQQSADVIYITCTNGNYPVYKLTRNTNTNWSLAEASFSGGPFADINSDKSSVVYTDQFRIWSEDGNDLPDGTPTTTSLCNITANTDIFQTAHVGCLFTSKPALMLWMMIPVIAVTYPPGLLAHQKLSPPVFSAVQMGNITKTWTAPRPVIRSLHGQLAPTGMEAVVMRRSGDIQAVAGDH